MKYYELAMYVPIVYLDYKTMYVAVVLAPLLSQVTHFQIQFLH